MANERVPVWEKANLSLEEAAAYSTTPEATVHRRNSKTGFFFKGFMA